MLSEQQRLVLSIVGATNKGTPTPINVTRVLVNEHGQYGATWQGTTRTIASLVRRGLVRRVSLSKMTYYQITPAGQQELDAGSE